MNNRIVQLGMCTADLARTVRLYCETFGFEDAGGRMVWGERSARIQELGNDTTGALWWLVGRQDFVNLEFFHHSKPAQRPLPSNWLPNSLGWVRWGFAVANFDAALLRLRSAQTAVGEVVTVDGLRRVCFRDPEVAVVVEMMEEGPALPRSGAEVEGKELISRVVYATLCVPDLAAARSFYADGMQMPSISAELHTPDMERLWGLPGARRESLVLDGGGVLLEIVQYYDPVGSRLPQRRLSDQGIMNVAFGYGERAALDRAMSRAVAGGSTINMPLPDSPVAATYIKDPFGNSLEMVCLPPSLRGSYGWESRSPSYR